MMSALLLPGGPGGGAPSKHCLVLVFVLLQLSSKTTATSTKIHTIHWNSSNPLFRIDRTDNVIDINGGNHPWEYDQVNIVCPVYKAGTDSRQQEQYIIYSVSKQEYESCRITQPSPKIVAICNRPHELMYFTITFRSFTPTPGGLEFRPGQDYYFISTSSKNDLHRRVGGGCSANNMKVVFRVAPDEHAEEESEGENIDDDNVVVRSRDASARPLMRNPKLQFPWSQERDFRRTFSYYNYDSGGGGGGSSSEVSKKSVDYPGENDSGVRHMAHSAGSPTTLKVPSTAAVLSAAVLLLMSSLCSS